jgi:hypothetical protein
LTPAGVGAGQDDIGVITLKRSMILFGVGACLLALSSAAFADDEVFSYSQDAAGTITINLSGVIPYCDDILGGFQGPPTSSVSENVVTINSPIFPGECNPPPGPKPPPTPYVQSILIGVLPNGNYSVDWVFTMIPQPVGPTWPPQDHYSSFTIEAAELAIFRDGFESP